MNIDNNIPDGSNNSGSRWLTRKIYETNAEKKKDFWIGFGLWWGLNILLALCSWGAFTVFGYSGIMFDGSTSTYSDLYSVLNCVLGLLPWVLNIGLIIYFALTRSQIAVGMVAGFGVALLITICLGVIFTVWCFYVLGNSSI